MTDQQLVECAFDVASESDDRFRKIGCAIRPSLPARTIITAANKVVRGSQVSRETLNDVMQKGLWIVPAEIRAIASAASVGIPTHEATMALTWFPTSETAKSIVEAEIQRLLAWHQAFMKVCGLPEYRKAADILVDGGVEVVWF